MRLVVYGPERRLGAWEGDQVIDLNHAYAKYLREAQDEPLPYEMAAAVVPVELGDFIISGPRAIEGAQRAVEYVTSRSSDQLGLRGENLAQPVTSVKLHAPYAKRARIMMAGGNYASRFGSSALVNLELGELIATRPADYVEIAARLAGDVERLGELRAGLRGRMLASPLLDAEGFTRHVEAAYRAMWSAWCGGVQA